MPVPMHIVTMPYFCLRRRSAMDERRGADRAGRAQRMAERDRAAQRVDLVRIQAEVADDGQALRGKGLVELDPVDARPASSRLA